MSEEAYLAFNESFALNLEGLLNVAALKGALGDLVERHEALRTTLSADGLTLCVSDAGQRNVAFLLLAFFGILFTIDRVSRKLLFKLFLLLLLLGSIAHFFRPLAYTLLLVTGRNPVCAFDEAVDGFYGKHDEQEKIRHHIERSTRRVEIDPEGFELWATSRGSFCTGIYLLEGAGYNQDPKKGASFIQKAARRNYSKAQYHLSLLYDTGRGIDQDRGQAYFWLCVVSRNPVHTDSPTKKQIKNDLKQVGKSLTRKQRADIAGKAVSWTPETPLTK